MEGPVTLRYVTFEMLCEWGIAPWVFDNAPRRYRDEMLAWYGWRNERRRAFKATSELNAKYK